MVVEIHLGGGQDPLNEDRPNYSRRAIDGLELRRPRSSMGENPLARVLVVDRNSVSNCSQFSGEPSKEGRSILREAWEWEGSATGVTGTAAEAVVGTSVPRRMVLSFLDFS